MLTEALRSESMRTQVHKHKQSLFCYYLQLPLPVKIIPSRLSGRREEMPYSENAVSTET
jgi:hypothetical protein